MIRRVARQWVVVVEELGEQVSEVALHPLKKVANRRAIRTNLTSP